MDSFEEFRHVIEALRQHEETARDRIRECFEPYVREVLARFVERHPEAGSVDRLLPSVMRWLMIHLMTRSEDLVAGLESLGTPERSLATYIQMAVLRYALWEPNRTSADDDAETPDELFVGDERSLSAIEGAWEMPADMEKDGCWSVRAWFQPRDDVGGDWFYVARTSDGALWTLVADTPGKSWPAYSLKRGVHLLWSHVLSDAVTSPDELLQRMHRQLIGNLPEGCFIEAAASRFDSTGAVQISSAGAGYAVWQCRAQRALQFEKLGGPYLGIDYGMDLPWNCGRRELERGDSVLMASDGLAEQPAQDAMVGQVLDELLDQIPKDCDLQQAIVQVLAQAIADSGRQHDDITLVTVSRQERVSPPEC